ncbi:MAG: hypothetical protein IJA85_06400 [Clostridia bacterium]|nr:hypothetical protein [Clostridia bacterium]
METIVFASTVAKLDSNVYTGGGTDDTAAIQALLDTAPERGHLHVIMDGAALVRGIKVHSNTTIECLNRDCGFFLADDSNCAVIENADRSYFERKTRNVSLIGGTYNHNAKGQLHHTHTDDPTYTFGGPFCEKLEGPNYRITLAMEFYGVENLLLRDLVIRNQRTWGFLACNFKYVTIEGCRFELPEKMFAQNQDGFHFWGPGQFLTIRDVGGRVGDDFMNLGPDEHDCKSDITDVLIDGVTLDEADQAIRMLTRGTGKLDRVTIRNFTGTYHGIGFYINNWFPPNYRYKGGELPPPSYGNLGNIFLENIDLRPKSPTYNPDTPFLFQIGGNIESLTVKNIRHHLPEYRYNLFRVGYPFYDMSYRWDADHKPRIGTLIVDGMHIEEYDDATAENDFMIVKQPVENLIVRDVDIIRGGNVKPSGRLLRVIEDGEIGALVIDRVYARRIAELVRVDDGKVDLCSMRNTLLLECENGELVDEKGLVGEIIE